MMSAIKSEFRKLLTIRSTYLISALGLVLVAFIGAYVSGYKAGPGARDPNRVMDNLLGMPPIISGFAAIIGILLLAHEYRYSTIMYTLVAANSRSKVLFAKVLALTAYAAVFSALAALVIVAAMYFGIGLSGNAFVDQTVYFKDAAWRIGFFIWSYCMAGLVFAAIVRNVVAAIVGIFILPTTIESLLGLVLKDKAVYLPFGSLQQVLTAANLSSVRAALIFLGYLAIAGSLAWLLFVRRDAN